jgi:hypothetical protein
MPKKNKNNNKINALVVVSETNNSVVIHFDGFDDLTHAKYFSEFMLDELGINSLKFDENRTIH